MSEGNALEWSLGLRNKANGKYLTQETFGYAINANGTSLKKKQTFYLVPGDGGVLFRTHLGRYLYSKADGTFKGDLERPDANAVWLIEPQTDGTWALRSKAHGYYAHGVEENLTAYTKELPEDGRWVVHLAMHPQINLFNVMRKRYVHLEDNELRATEDVPWGDDALLTFVFFDEHPCGRYGLLASNGCYLNSSGQLVPNYNRDCQFLLGFHDEYISLRDETGKFLSCVGSKAVLKGKALSSDDKKITKDELFQISDSEPQFVIRDSKGKFVSIRSSIELKADQVDITDRERFQFEVDPKGTGLTSFKCNTSVYWSINAEGTLSATGKAKERNELFKIEWLGTKVKFVASNGKYLQVKSNGAIIANGNGSDETSVFTLTIINRPELVLRGQYGFVGIKGASGRVEVNKARGDIFKLDCKDGAYRISHGGKYWTVDPDGVAVASSTPVDFFLEFVERSKFLIKHAESGKYLEGEQNGGFRASGSGPNANTLWEY